MNTSGLPRKPGSDPDVATLKRALEQEPFPTPGSACSRYHDLVWDADTILVRDRRDGAELRIDGSQRTTLQVARATFDRRNWLARVLRRPRRLEQRLALELRTAMTRVRLSATPPDSRHLVGLSSTAPRGADIDYDDAWGLIQTARSLGARLELELPSDALKRRSDAMLQALERSDAPMPAREVSPSGSAEADARDLEEVLSGLEPEPIRDADALERALRDAPRPRLLELPAGAVTLRGPLPAQEAPLGLVGAGARRTTLRLHDVTLEAHAGLVLRDLSVEAVGDGPRDVIAVRAGGSLVARRCQISGGRDAPEARAENGCGVRMRGGGSLLLERCLIVSNGGHGVALTDGAVTIRECRIQANLGHGLRVAGEAEGLIGTNQILENGLNGCALCDACRVVFEHNLCGRNRGGGISMSASRDAVFRDNTCEDNAGDGIRLSGEACARLEANVARRNRGCGLRVMERARASGHDNETSHNDASGARVEGSAQLDLERLESRENRHHGAWARGTSRLQLGSCVCSENASSGMAASDQAELQAERCACERNAEVGARLEDQARGAILRCTCRGNSAQGVLVDDRAEGVILHNRCLENGGDGVAFAASARGRAESNHCAHNGGRGVTVARTGAVVESANRLEGNADDPLLKKLLKS